MSLLQTVKSFIIHLVNGHHLIDLYPLQDVNQTHFGPSEWKATRLRIAIDLQYSDAFDYVEHNYQHLKSTRYGENFQNELELFPDEKNSKPYALDIKVLQDKYFNGTFYTDLSINRAKTALRVTANIVLHID